MGRKLAVIAAVLYWPHLALAVTRDWVNPQPTRERLYAVCAARYDCVFAVGDGGTIIHWNGQRWQEMESGTGLRLYDVWGSSGTDVWAVGGQGPYEGAPPDSLLLHYDGQRWSRQAIGAREALRAVWGAGPNCAVAVGPESVIFRWDGQQWTTLAAPEGDRLHFTDVWCSGPDDIWPVDTRVLYHWNGVNWERAETGASRGVDKVCGVSPAEVYCAGPRCVARFDGQTWTAITPPDLYYDEDVDAMWASGPDSLFVAINDFGNLMSRLCHWDGSVWSVAGELSLIDSHQKVLGVSGTGPRNVFCVGESGALYRSNGSAAWPERMSAYEARFWDVWAAGPGEYLLACNEGIFCWRGAGLEPMDTPTSEPVYALHAAANGPAIAAGANGLVWQRDGVSWLPLPRPSYRDLWAVWAADNGVIFVGGADGYIHRWDGSEWRELDSGRSGTIQSLWGTGPDDVFCGGTSFVLRWDGASWKPEQAAVSNVTDLFGIGGDIWAADGRLWRRSGSTWAVVPSGGCFGLWGPDPSHLFLAHGNVHYWTQNHTFACAEPPPYSLRRIRGWPGQGCLAVGEYGIAIYYPDQPPPLRVLMNKTENYPTTGGGTVSLSLVIQNPTTETLRNASLAAVLEIAGSYYCWPSWRQLDIHTGEGFDHILVDVPPGSMTLEIIPFTSIGQTAPPFTAAVYAALLEPDRSAVLGELGTAVFVYAPATASPTASASRHIDDCSRLETRGDNIRSVSLAPGGVQ